jgi:hypothetical protein
MRACARLVGGLRTFLLLAGQPFERIATSNFGGEEVSSGVTNTVTQRHTKLGLFVTLLTLLVRIPLSLPPSLRSTRLWVQTQLVFPGTPIPWFHAFTCPLEFSS